MEHEMPEERNAFIVVYDGVLGVGDRKSKTISARELAMLGPEDTVRVSTGKKGAKFLFASGRSLLESIVWDGSIVMNARQELDQAFAELKDGTFIK